MRVSFIVAAAVLAAGCARAQVLVDNGDASFSDEQDAGFHFPVDGAAPTGTHDLSTGNTSQDLSSGATHDGGIAAPFDAAMPAGGDMATTCGNYMSLTPCASVAGLSAYCLQAGETRVFRGEVTIQASDTFVALGPGSVSGTTALGYFSSSDPITCIATSCDHGTAVQNTAGGKICDVTFDTSQTTSIVGTGLFALTASPTATPGDYRVSYTSQGMLTNSPDFYLRITAQ